MEYKYKEVNVNYSFYDNNSKLSLVYLHGWGQNIEMMMPIAKPFIKDYNVLIIDLPGFGKSSEPDHAWTLYDYSEMVHDLVAHLKLKNVVLIGHSFGGKISICYALDYKVNKLILLASPYRKSNKTESFKTKILKKLKKVPGLSLFEETAKKFFGSTDYKNASPVMRQILVDHINTDLSEQVKHIKASTLLIWGTNDMAASYEDAVLLEKLIPDCGLVTYEGCSHYAYLENLNQTINVINSFIGSDSK